MTDNRAAANGWSWEVQSEPWHLRLVQFVPDPSHHGAATPHGLPLLQSAPQPTLKVGSAGGQVAALQFFCLKYQWGDCGRADGSFGPRTEAAVKAMQTALGAVSDGIYGPKSATALGDHLKRSPA